MRRVSYKSYVLLFLFVFVMLSMPERATEKIRSFAVASLSPSWRGVRFLKDSFFKITTVLPSGGMMKSPAMMRELELLRLENQNLRRQMELFEQQTGSDSLLEQMIGKFNQLSTQKEEFFQRRKGELLRLIDDYSQAVSAKVIFRDPASWSSSFWVNVGERTNRMLGRKVVAKNSPVVIGSAVVGMVEYISENRSRVRLISDSGVVPSVRTIRGMEQNRFLLEHVEALLLALEHRNDLPESVQTLNSLKEVLSRPEESFYLAKGELYGTSTPLWRSRGTMLHGVGFNYDFADEEGPARHLSSKEPPLLKTGDLLITTGMDGVFPAGLRIAQIVKIHNLKEGASSYDLEAKIAAGDLGDLAYVFVLPPIESD